MIKTQKILFVKNGNETKCFFISGNKKYPVGVIQEDTKTYYKTIPKGRHFRKNNSLAVSSEILERDFEYIVIKYGNDTYITTKNYFTAHSKANQFPGLEKQNFLPISKFGIEKAEDWERSNKKHTQYSIFDIAV